MNRKQKTNKFKFQRVVIYNSSIISHLSCNFTDKKVDTNLKSNTLGQMENNVERKSKGESLRNDHGHLEDVYNNLNGEDPKRC